MTDKTTSPYEKIYIHIDIPIIAFNRSISPGKQGQRQTNIRLDKPAGGRSKRENDNSQGRAVHRRRGAAEERQDEFARPARQHTWNNRVGQRNTDTRAQRSARHVQRANEETAGK